MRELDRVRNKEMLAQFDDIDDFISETPTALAPLATLYEFHASNPTSASPLHAFLYLIGYPERENYLPYDYTPDRHFAILELDLLAKALMTYTNTGARTIEWLDQLCHLADEQELDLASRTY
jgi:hypothetical protein